MSLLPWRSSLPVFAVTFLLVSAGCTCGKSTPPDAGAPADAGTRVTSLDVRLTTLDGAPIIGATVSVGTSSAVSDPGGLAKLGVVAAGRAVVQVHAPGFVPAARALQVPEGVAVELPLVLQVRGRTTRFNAASGVNTEKDGVWVNLPGSAVVDATGAPVTGEVSLTVSPVDPVSPALASAPFPLEGAGADGGTDLSLDSLFMADVSLWGPNDEPLRLAPGKSVTLGLPVSASVLARYPVGSSVPAWWFDLDAGTWVEEGAGTIVADSSVQDGGARWVAHVAHLTSWNSDNPAASACLLVTVLDLETNQPIEGAELRTRGTSFTGGSSAVTGADGRACILMRKGSTGTLLARKVGYDDETKPVSTPDMKSVCSDSPLTCTPEVIRLRVGNCLQGRVIEADGTPLALAEVVGVMTASNGDTVSYSRRSDNDGYYCLPAPRSTAVQLHAQRVVNNSLQETKVKSATTEATEAVCSGRNPCTPGPTLQFLRTCVSGLVKSHAGLPIEGATVEGVYGHSMVRAVTGADGHYCLNAPRATDLRVGAWKLGPGRPQLSSILQVTTQDVELACGSASCTQLADLELLGATCLKGNVQDAAATPVEDATFTALLTNGDAITADSDAMGDYCLEVPAGIGYSIVGRREVDGLPQQTMEIVGSAPTNEATCSGGGCASLPQLSFEENTCVEGMVRDPAGAPLDRTVTASWGFRASAGDVDVASGATGQFCVGAPRNKDVTLFVGEDRGGYFSSAFAQVSSGAISGRCGGNACVQSPPLVLPKLTCINLQVNGTTGAPEGNARVGVQRPGLWFDYMSADATGKLCLTVPQGVPLTLVSGYNQGPLAATSFTTGTGPDVACGDPGCTAATLSLPLVENGCLRGRVVDAVGAGVPQAEVFATWQGAMQFDTEFLLADATGSYCVPSRPGTLTRVTATGPGGVASLDVVPTGSGATCSASPATCQLLPDLVPRSGLRTCVKGRAHLRGQKGLPAPAGTHIYAFTADPNITCGTDPSTWGTLAEQTVAGPNGEFCFTQDLDTNAGPRWINVGGCDFITEPGLMHIQQVPDWYVPGTCGSPFCYDLGDFETYTWD